MKLKSAIFAALCLLSFNVRARSIEIDQKIDGTYPGIQITICYFAHFLYAFKFKS